MIRLDSAVGIKSDVSNRNQVSGEFIDFGGERYYAIRNVDKMPPFFISVVSNVDHWLFVSSTGGLSAGRVSPETALFPYLAVDKVHESAPHTGPKTLLRADVDGKSRDWEPFNREHDGRYSIERNLYKNVLGNKLCFEEWNQDLRLAFRYTWATSDEYGFVRRCEVQNLSGKSAAIELLDGLQNILPAGTPLYTQTNLSTLVDAYKWTELESDTGLALFTLYSGITDRAEPSESLKANTAFCLGLETSKVLISSEQLDRFREARSLEKEIHKRGVRGAFFVSDKVDLSPYASREWQIVANIEQSQAQVVALLTQLRESGDLSEAIGRSVDKGADELARIVAGCDGFQSTAEENVAVHHYANVLFNVMRGGCFQDQHRVLAKDLLETIRHFNRDVFARNEERLSKVPDQLAFGDLLAFVAEHGDAHLARLCYEYLPITFGRRHGDPSRPWNHFAIRVRDELGNPRLWYEGNWRDIFQNWEALAFSYPEFVESIIAKFVNASTIDGHNPYRISKLGIDWEAEDREDPWSYIGYWGDHQIIYLLKMLELSDSFHPTRLRDLLREPLFTYANVPYRIRPFEALIADSKSTVDYDHELAERIEERVLAMGADGKLLLDAEGNVYQVNLLEKLLVPLLAKLGNLVIGGGIWMNTQRPEWNDANNALVGQGLSMVTLYYMRRYIRFLQNLIGEERGSFELSNEVGQWLEDSAAALRAVRPHLGAGRLADEVRYASLAELGRAAGRYRSALYDLERFSGKLRQSRMSILAMLDDAMAAIDHSISVNVGDDGLYHAYNTLHFCNEGVAVDTLYPMLEGQVSVLSSGALDAAEAIKVLEALFASAMYRGDQHSFMLYPDRSLPGFLEKNRISAEDVSAVPLLGKMSSIGDRRIVLQDAAGCYRFAADFRNVGDLNHLLDTLRPEYGTEIEAARRPLNALFEKTFRHREFTGRSGSMFAFEGLGSIYWHMVAKLLLAVQENYFAAIDSGADVAVCGRLGGFYYRVREGLGFKKTPGEYGAFPTDPYSHSPENGGAKQPGMTGQVKEEVLSRFGELGLRVRGGRVRFQPNLLRPCEFTTTTADFRFLDVGGMWRKVELGRKMLGFTWCQVPIVYRLNDDAEVSLTLALADGTQQVVNRLVLSREDSSELFQRSGRIRQISISLTSEMLFTDFA